MGGCGQKAANVNAPTSQSAENSAEVRNETSTEETNAEGAAPVNTIEIAKAKAIEHWSGPSSAVGTHVPEVRSVEKLKGTAVTSLLAHMHAFRVVVSNPRAAIAGPPSMTHTLVLDGESTHFLDDYQAVATFLSERTLARVTSKSSAEQLLSSFAELSNLQAPTAKHLNMPGVKNNTEFSSSDWNTNLRQDGDAWNANVTYLVDPIAYRFIRLALTFSADGTMTVRIEKSFFLRGYS